jgi:hypothetical protein
MGSSSGWDQTPGTSLLLDTTGMLITLVACFEQFHGLWTCGSFGNGDNSSSPIRRFDGDGYVPLYYCFVVDIEETNQIYLLLLWMVV